MTSDSASIAKDQTKLSRLPFLAAAGMVGGSEPGRLFSGRGEDALAGHTLDHADDLDNGLVLWRRPLADQQDRCFLSRGWLALLVMPVFIISLAQVLGAFIAGDPPFAGLEKTQLARTYAWLASAFFAVGLGYLLMRLARMTSWMHIRRIGAAAAFGILSVITFRAAWMASFINYDLPTELLVYAHAGPASSGCWMTLKR